MSQWIAFSSTFRQHPHTRAIVHAVLILTVLRPDAGCSTTQAHRANDGLAAPMIPRPLSGRTSAKRSPTFPLTTPRTLTICILAAIGTTLERWSPAATRMEARRDILFGPPSPP